MSHGSFGGRLAVRPRSTPPPVVYTPPPASDGGSIGATIVAGIVIVFSLVVGERVMERVMGPRTIRVISEDGPSRTKTVGDPCGTQSKAFQDCASMSGNDISKCQYFLDVLNECKKNSGNDKAA